MANVVFCILCILYVLCAVSVVCDLLHSVFGVSNNLSIRISFLSSVAQSRMDGALSLQLQIDLLPILNRIVVAQNAANAICDFTSQCIIVRINHSSRIYHPFYSPKSSKIYRCWIVWGKKIRIIIIPSFLAITLLGQ